MTTNGPNRILDEFAKMMTDAAGAAQGVRKEAENMMKAQAERLIASMDLVNREEFDAMRDMAVKARAENKALTARLDGLEARLEALETARPASKTAAKATAKSGKAG